MRLFTGIEIPQPLAHTLALLKGSLFPARWVKPEDYHITLRFIGSVPEYLARDLDEMLDRTMRKPFTLTTEKLDVFGGDHPRALIVRIAMTEPLRELQQEHERICRKLGIVLDSRKFTPHITLARLRNISPLDTADWLAHRGIFHQQSFEVSHFTLFSANASTGGGPYVAEARYPLRATAPVLL